MFAIGGRQAILSNIDIVSVEDYCLGIGVGSGYLILPGPDKLITKFALMIPIIYLINDL